MRVNHFRFFILVFFLIIFKFDENLASINNKIVAKVGNEIITSYELENKVRLILFLSNKEINQENINTVKKKALGDLINQKLKKIEIIKYGITSDTERVDSYISNLSQKFKLNKIDFMKIMSQSQIDIDLYREEIQINLSWQSLIYQINKNKIILDDDQLVRELNKIMKNRKKIEEYELAEILIETVDDINKQSKIINEIKNYINESNFREAAIKFSISPSSTDGGNIGWISSDSLSKNLSDTLKNMKLGEVSDAIKSSNQILFIQLLNRRQVSINSKLDAENVKNSLINKRKNELLNLYSNNHLSKKRNNTIIKINNEQ